MLPIPAKAAFTNLHGIYSAVSKLERSGIGVVMAKPLEAVCHIE
jgi:hypothetical protein